MAPLYTHRTLVRFTHTDPAGYVFFPRFFEMFQAAVEDWFNDCLELNYAEQILVLGVGFPTARTECECRRPCRLGEVLELRLVLEAIGTSSLTLRFDGSVRGEPRLRARSVLVAIEMQQGRPQPLGALLRERLQAYLALCQADPAAPT
jgi:4-hydroxybenzoyl-CoA thioesterase